MKKNLPKVYAMPINKKYYNNQEQTILDNKDNINIDDIFNDERYTFKRKYLITLKNNKVVTSSIISKQNNNLLTIDGDILDIDDIKTIVEIKK